MRPSPDGRVHRLYVNLLGRFQCIIDFNAGEIITGLLYIDESRMEMHELMDNVDTPLSQLPLDSLHPGAAELKKILKRYS